MYSLKKKMEVINYILDNDSSYTSAEKEFNISREVIRIWLYRYKHGGKSKLKRQNNYKKYTGQFKVDVVEYMYEHQFSCKKTSMIFMLSNHLVKEWDLVYRHEGKDVLLKGNYMRTSKKKNLDLDKKSRTELLEEIEQLRMENAYLKKLRALIQKGTKPNSGKK